MHEAHGALAQALMSTQAGAAEAPHALGGATADPRLRSDWHGSIARSYAAVSACWRSWDGGAEWCEVARR